MWDEYSSPVELSVTRVIEYMTRVHKRRMQKFESWLDKSPEDTPNWLSPNTHNRVDKRYSRMRFYNLDPRTEAHRYRDQFHSIARSIPRGQFGTGLVRGLKVCCWSQTARNWQIMKWPRSQLDELWRVTRFLNTRNRDFELCRSHFLTSQAIAVFAV